MVITRTYIEYAIITHKDNTKEKVYLESDRLEYGDDVFKKIDKAWKKSRPRIKGKWIIRNPDASDNSPVYIEEPITELNDPDINWLNKWYEFQVKLILNTHTKDYYNVKRMNGSKDIIKVHKNYIKLLPKEYIWTLKH